MKKILAPKGGNKKTGYKEKLIFKSTSFGDDLDRALTKDDGRWTYFTVLQRTIMIKLTEVSNC